MTTPSRKEMAPRKLHAYKTWVTAPLRKKKKTPLQKPVEAKKKVTSQKPYEDPMFAGMRKKAASDKAAKAAERAKAKPKRDAARSKYKQTVAARKARVREHEAQKAASRGRRQVARGKPG